MISFIRQNHNSVSFLIIIYYVNRSRVHEKNEKAGKTHKNMKQAHKGDDNDDDVQ